MRLKQCEWVECCDSIRSNAALLPKPLKNCLNLIPPLIANLNVIFSVQETPHGTYIMNPLLEHINLNIPPINVNLLRRLSDLPKYGIDAVSMSTLYDASITTIIDNMQKCASNNDRIAFIKFGQQAVTQKQHLFNVHVHRTLVHGLSRFSSRSHDQFVNQYDQACINYKNLLIKFSNMHINECNLCENQHNHKKIRYM